MKARDWILLPLCSLLTVAVLLFLNYFLISRKIPKGELYGNSCLIMTDPLGAVRGRPNSTCPVLRQDTGLTEVRYNSCGHRTNLNCTPPPAGTFRILLLGSSMVFGLNVAAEKTYAVKLPERLSQATGKTVDVYNMGMLYGTPRSVALRLNEVFALKPNLVVWPLTTFDLDFVNLGVHVIPGQPEEDERRPGAIAIPHAAPKAEDSGLTASIERKWKTVLPTAENSRTIFALTRLLYQSHSYFLDHFETAGEREHGQDAAGFLHKTPPLIWEQHIQDFEYYFGDVADRLRAQGIPIAVVLLPHRVQADMVSVNQWPRDDDPYALGKWIAPVVMRHGGIYFDILHDFRTVPDPDHLWFPYDGHMTSEGHAVLTDMISREMEKAVLPKTALNAKY